MQMTSKVKFLLLQQYTQVSFRYYRTQPSKNGLPIKSKNKVPDMAGIFSDLVQFTNWPNQSKSPLFTSYSLMYCIHAESDQARLRS